MNRRFLKEIFSPRSFFPIKILTGAIFINKQSFTELIGDKMRPVLKRNRHKKSMIKEEYLDEYND